MKIFVCIKQVPDTETKLKLSANGLGIDESGIKWVMNPYDEFAVEEALKIKSKNPDWSVCILSVGPKKRIVDALRTALAMGADEAIAIDTSDHWGPQKTAEALAKVIRQEGDFQFILTGKLGIDYNQACVPQMLAELLQISHSNEVSKVDYNDGETLTEREIEGGAREVLAITGPVLLGANKGLNTPRYASLPGIMKAKKKPLKEIDGNQLDITASDIKYSNFMLPKEKVPVVMINGDAHTQAKSLAQLLREEAKVL